MWGNANLEYLAHRPVRYARACRGTPDWIQVFFAAMRVDFTKMHGLGNDFIIFDSPVAGFRAGARTVAAPGCASHGNRL